MFFGILGYLKHLNRSWDPFESQDSKEWVQFANLSPRMARWVEPGPWRGKGSMPSWEEKVGYAKGDRANVFMCMYAHVSLEEGMTTHSSLLAWNTVDRGARRATIARVRHDWEIKHRD